MKPPLVASIVYSEIVQRRSDVCLSVSLFHSSISVAAATVGTAATRPAYVSDSSPTVDTVRVDRETNQFMLKSHFRYVMNKSPYGIL